MSSQHPILRVAKRKMFCLVNFARLPISMKTTMRKKDPLHYAQRQIEFPSVYSFLSSRYPGLMMTKDLSRKITIFSLFRPFFGSFSPLTSEKNLKTDLKFLEEVLPIKFRRVCKSYHQWIKFAQMLPLQRVLFGEIWIKVWFLAILK